MIRSAMLKWGQETCHGADPFSGVDCSVEKDSGLRALSSTSPDMDAGQCPSLHRASSGEELRLAWKASLQVAEERKMVRVGMIGGEPRLTWN